MEKQRRKRLAFWAIATLLFAAAVAVIVSDVVRHWLHEAFCYVFWSAVVLIPVVFFFLIPSPEQDRRDRSRRTVDWEMEQNRLREQAEEEEWLEEHR